MQPTQRPAGLTGQEHTVQQSGHVQAWRDNMTCTKPITPCTEQVNFACCKSAMSVVVAEFG